MKHNLSSTSRPRGHGFSLVEIMVVVAIIFVLMGLSLIAMKKVSESANTKQARLLLNQMMSIEGEYRRTARQSINHYSANAYTQKPFNWTTVRSRNNPDEPGADAVVPNTDAHVKGSIEAFVWATLQLPACDAMYSGLRADRSLRDGDPDANTPRLPDGFFEVVDTWGTPIRYYLRNVDEDLYAAGDPERDNYSTDTMRYHATPFFVSAGPDREWGNVSAAGGSTAWKQAQDNIYSFDLE